MPVMTTLEREQVYQKLERVSNLVNDKGKNQALWTVSNLTTPVDSAFVSLSSSSTIESHEANTTQSSNKDQGEPTIAGKKKTPMCLVNELARYHKLQPQYRLIEESGPAHQKSFVVSLKLDNEEYVGTGQSIKKAQHAAAQLALETTSFHLPEIKLKAKNATSSHGAKAVTPTVELNALAMKFNLTPIYNNLLVAASSDCIEFAVSDSALPSANVRQQGDFRLNHNVPPGQYLNADFQNPIYRQRPPTNQRSFYNRRLAPKIHRVSLTVGDVTVTGEGTSPQAARHDAAQQALAELSEKLPSKIVVEDVTLVNDIESESGLKSPVSLAHELALKLNQSIEFIVLSESGPPHLRTFVVQCKLGNFSSQGEGNCKKLAKKKAAESVLEEWKKSHPKGLSSPCDSVFNGKSKQKPKSSFAKKKPKNLVKETSVTTSCIGSKAPDPISQLVQLQQGKKEKEPIFTLISEKGIRRQPEFVMQVTVGSITEIGTGLKKKDAKRAAALKALETLGALKDLPRQAIDRADEIETVNIEKPLNGQVIPGLLVIGSTQHQEKKPAVPVNVTMAVGNGMKELPVTSQPSKATGALRPEIRLRYLAHVLEYEVEFSDFPKGKKGEFVTLVTLNTNPPQVSHGLGSTLEEAHDNAASNMLQLIAEGALDSDDANKEGSANGSGDRS